ncbi:hypothetical protein O6H91_01G141400 [Diphasiastrum complanatum]|uniref:Uncharacterized protein n=1 Tax=Diphasiastrum complanatum TaxID=34168 RepID=A0ACC2EWV5_DIPCM|nr:hypothetical protein O6H91_01G141400 [Diphasiastrum complanatum]
MEVIMSDIAGNVEEATLKFAPDSRMQWLKGKVCIALDISDSVFDAFLKDEAARSCLTGFLDASELCLVFFTEESRSGLEDGSLERLKTENGASSADANIEVEQRGVKVLHACTNHFADDRTFRTVMYFVKLETGRIKPEQVDRTVEYGVLPLGPSLSTLEQLLFQLFIPALARDGAPGEASFWASEDANIMEHTGSELLSSMRRFSLQVLSANQLLTGDAQLFIPAVSSESLQKAEVDYELVLQLETVVTDWVQAIDIVIRQETEKDILENNPLVELEFWRERSNALSRLYEQLNFYTAKKVLAVMEAGSTNLDLLGSFKTRFAELAKMFREAKDNVKFLTTMERHFKTIKVGPLPRVLEIISPMMNALRMVWIISRYYSDDAHMASLMERIACQIVEKVRGEINLKIIFNIPANDASFKINTAKSVLEAWSKVYLEVREHIEVVGRDPRWEFDRIRLFEQTGYMACICTDLLHILEVYYDFHNFLGPELKAVTGDSQGIDSVVQKVAAMVEPLEKLPFDIFDKSYALQWSATVSNFNTEKDIIEHLTKAFIDTSFKKLRSAEGT